MVNTIKDFAELLTRVLSMMKTKCSMLLKQMIGMI